MTRDSQAVSASNGPPANADQDAYWNGEEASHWIAHVDRYDAMLESFNRHLLGAAPTSRTDTLLDIGCGCGATTRAAAQVVSDGLVVGLDLSRPMIEIATERARRDALDNVRFERADVEAYAFDAEAFDGAISRFGVMFFADPVAAFSNLAYSLRPRGHLTFVCWQELLRNDWITVPGAAVAAHVPLPDVGDSETPGPFSLADPDRVREVLGRAGFDRVEIASVDEPVTLGKTVDDTVQFLAATGMGRTMLVSADEPTRSRALMAVSDALGDYESDNGVRLGSCAWLVTARRRP